MATPPHPEVSDNAIDFVLANRDLLGPNMKKTLGRLKLRAQSQMKTEEAIQNRRLWKHFMTLESSISAPFRQMLLDAEGKVGPNFGNLDLNSFCSGELYERTACYLVLKGMVAHWEKKVREPNLLKIKSTHLMMALMSMASNSCITNFSGSFVRNSSSGIDVSDKKSLPVKERLLEKV